MQCIFHHETFFCNRNCYIPSPCLGSETQLVVLKQNESCAKIKLKNMKVMFINI